MTTDTKGTCSICPAPAIRTRKDCTGFMHRACAEHASHLDGWVREVEREMRCEQKAAAAFERAAYGLAATTDAEHGR